MPSWDTSRSSSKGSVGTVRPSCSIPWPGTVKMVFLSCRARRASKPWSRPRSCRPRSATNGPGVFSKHGFLAWLRPLSRGDQPRCVWARADTPPASRSTGATRRLLDQAEVELQLTTQALPSHAVPTSTTVLDMTASAVDRGHGFLPRFFWGRCEAFYVVRDVAVNRVRLSTLNLTRSIPNLTARRGQPRA